MDDDERHAAHIAMMQRRRPQHFNPWENVRPNGHRLADAILELTLPSFRSTVSELLADEEVGFLGRSSGFRDHLWRHVWWRLQQGQLFMRGLEIATGAEWQSEPRMFDDAEPDFARNRITCFGQTFASIRVYETSQASGEKLATAWMLQNVTTYVANQRDDRVSDCMAATGVKKDDAKAGWMALPELIRGRSRQSR